MVANLYLIFSFSLAIILGPDSYVFQVLRYVFLGLIITQYVLGLGKQGIIVMYNT